MHKVMPFTDSEVGMKEDSLTHLWRRIVDELAELQDRSPEETHGHIVNSISGQVYYRDTAFGARVFATEYELTGQIEWRLRAESAIDALLSLDLFVGLEEPIWNRYGWHRKKGSLPATAMLLDALWVTMKQLGMEQPIGEWSKLLCYLERCMIKPGIFAHDAIKKGAQPPPVQNTTAMVLLLMEYMVLRCADPNVDLKRLEAYLRKTRKAIYCGQRSDGVWPYVYPNLVQRLGFNLAPVRFLAARCHRVRHALMKSGDVSIMFVDGIHNAYVFYFLLKSLLIRGNIKREDRDVVTRGWYAIRKRLVQQADGSIQYDFSEEPRPYTPRYCSFFATTVYFLILAVLPMLRKLDIIDKAELTSLGHGIVRHIKCNLLEKPGVYPCIKPNEGPEEIVRNILPHVGESVAFRGACLSDWLLYKAKPASMKPS